MFEIKSSSSWADLDAVIVRSIKELYRRGGNQELKILEAGCGQKWTLDLADTKHQITGVDVDADALNIRMTQRKDLDVAIHGDLTTVELQPGSFDVIYCAYVLEHIEEAELALQRMISWLAPGGLLILRVPDPETFRGFVTRVTPHWFHVAYYRWIKGKKDAGKPGHGPYKTVFHPIIWRKRLFQFTSHHELVCNGVYADTFRKEPGQRSGGYVMRQLTRGRIADAYNDLLYIFRAPGSATLA